MDSNNKKETGSIKEKYFRSLLEHLEDFIIVINSSGIIKFASPSIFKILEFTPEEVIGTPAFRFVHADDIERTKKEYDELIAAPGSVQEVTLKVVNKSGSIRIIQGHRKNLLNDPDIEGIVLTVHDITDHINSEAEIKLSNNLLENVESLSHIGGWEWDEVNKTMTWTNETYLIHELDPKDIGPKSKEHIAESISCYSAEDRPKISEAFNRCVSEGTPYELECRFTTFKGRKLWIRTLGRPVYENGRIVKVHGNIIDITVPKRDEILNDARLHLIENSYESEIDEFLQEFLDTAEKLTDSKIGFYHFVDDDQNYLHLQMWSTNTINSMCTARGKGSHYEISKAGVWANCFYTRRPEIHNNYENMNDKKGLPDGHARVIRELVVPLIRHDKVVAILGVGNKESDYDENDIEILTKLAESAWDITNRKKIEEEKARTALLLDSIRSIQSKYLTEGDPDTAFNALLESLISLTKSEFGFLDEVLYEDDGTPYKLNLAISNIAWNEESRILYEKLKARKLEFRNLNTLSGLPVLTGKIVLTNEAAHDPRSAGLPGGHPQIKSFLGIPLYYGGNLVGVAGIANRKEGYNEEIASFLEPFLSTCSSFIHSVRLAKKERAAVEALRQNEEITRTLLNGITESVFLMSKEGTVIASNSTTAERLGVTVNELMSKNMFDIIPREVADKRRVHLDEAYETGKSVRFEDERRGRFIDNRIYPLRDQEGRVNLFAIFGIDTTDQKILEIKLKESEERFRLALKNSPITVFQQDLNLKYTWVYNPRPVFNSEIIIGKTDHEFFPIHEAEILTKIKQEVLRTNNIAREIIQTNIEDKTFYYDLTVEPLYDEKGKTVGITCACIDITENKKAERLLSESEERFRQIVERSSEIFYRQNFETRKFEYFSPKIESVLGYTPEEALEFTFEKQKELIHPDDLPRLMNFSTEIVDADKKGITSIEREFLLKAKDGNYKWMHGSYTLIKDENDNPKLIVGGLSDITEKKIAEEKIRISEERYRLINNSSIDAVYSYDLNGRFTSANKSLCKLLGLTYEQIIGKTHFELGFPQNLCDEWYALHKRVKETNTTVMEETVAPVGDGTVHNFEVVLNPLHDITGNIIGISGVTRDITERKIAEKQKEENNAFVADVLNSVPENTAVIDKEGNIVLVNSKWKQFALENADLQTALCCCAGNYLEICKNATSDDSNEANLAYKGIIDILEGKKEFFELEYPCHSPRVQRWFLMRAVPLLSGRGGAVISHINITSRKLIEENEKQNQLLTELKNRELEEKNDELKQARSATLNIIEDLSREIEERKTAVKALRESEEKFRAIAEQIDALISLTDTNGIITYTSPAANSIFGYSPDEMCGKLFADFLDPSYIPKAVEAFQKAVEKNINTENIELLMRRKDDSLFYGELNGSRFEVGADKGTLVVIRDISDRKEAEKSLKEKMDELERFNNLTVDREIKMIELKKEINRLSKKLGLNEKYKIPE